MLLFKYLELVLQTIIFQLEGGPLNFGFYKFLLLVIFLRRQKWESLLELLILLNYSKLVSLPWPSSILTSR